MAALRSNDLPAHFASGALAAAARWAVGGGADATPSGIAAQVGGAFSRSKAGVPMTKIIKDLNHPSGLASEMDSEWFADNPCRFLRVRYPTDGDGEGGPLSPNAVVVVFCPSDGIRFRLTGALTEPLHNFDTDSDADIIPGARGFIKMLGEGGKRMLKTLEACNTAGGRLANFRWP
jgi:hypothetical protein